MTLGEFVDRIDAQWRTTADMQSGPYRRVLLADPCVYCGATARGLDHIEPRAAVLKGTINRWRKRQWSNSWENRAPACRNCDEKKAALGLLFYLIRRAQNLRAVRGW